MKFASVGCHKPEDEFLHKTQERNKFIKLGLKKCGFPLYQYEFLNIRNFSKDFNWTNFASCL